MSKVAIQGNASGTGTFTIESPATNTDRTLTLPDEAGTVLTSASTFGVSQLPSQLSVNASASSGSLAIDSAGHVTMPYQPSFRTTKNGNYTETSGDNRVESWNSLSNVGNHLNATTGRFTAPVTGRYLFTFSPMYYNLSADTQWRLYKNGGNLISSNDTGKGATLNQVTVTAVIELNAGDYIEPYAYSSSSSSGIQVYSGNYSTYTGMLLG